MEVSLLEADGIPEGCIISVRAGTTRRQAAVEAGKPCKLAFPKGVSYANPFKVDLLAPLGDTTFEVNNASEKYPFEVKSRYGGKSMHVTLRVREDSSKAACLDELDGLHSVHQSIGESLNTSCSGETSARRHQAALGQRAYFDSHNLLSWVHDLMQDLARDRPEDPWSYIDASTASARKKSKSATAAASATSAPSAAMQQDCSTPSAGPASLTPFRSYYQSHFSACPASYWSQLHSRFPVAKSAKTKDSKQDEDALRSRAKAALTSGKLENALKLPKAAAEADQPAQDMEVLRAHAKATLKAALTSGKLDNALLQSQGPSAEADQLAQEEDALRALAKAALTSGNLKNALQQSKAPSADQPAQEEEALRSRAKAALTSGKLENALKLPKAPAEADQFAQATHIEEQLRKRAVEALSKRGRPGLAKALLMKAGAPNEELRGRAVLELLVAADDGRLTASASDACAESAGGSTSESCRRTTVAEELEASKRNAREALAAAFLGAPAEGLTSTSVAAPPVVAPAVAPSKPGEVSAGIVRHSNSSSVLKTPLAPLPASPARSSLKQQNDALRRENVRLKKLREAGDAANTLCSENDRLRSELGKLFSLHKKDTTAGSRSTGSLGRGY